MKTPRILQRILSWFSSERYVRRLVEDIVTDYSTWNPLD